MSGATIEEGSGVIIRKGTYMRFEEVQCKKKLSIHKQHFFLDNAIGCFYGTTFKVGKNGQLTIIGNARVEQPKPTFSSGENNQFLNDDGSSQKLTKDAIMDLKAQGFEGEDIIEQLVENSETFEKKTEFSQEKYLNKKRNRHLARITILKPTLRLVCEMVYNNSASKILELRMDTVSQMLTMANIHSDMNVLLLENTQSFLAGAILHRMAGRGNVVQLYSGDFPIRLLLPPFGLSEGEKKILCGFPIHKISNLHSLENEDTEENPSQILEEMDTTELATVTEQACVANEENSSDNNGQSQKDKRKFYNKPLTQKEKLLRKINRTDEERRALDLLKEASFDCLIIAAKFRAKDVVLRLVEFLAPSRPVVVYSQYKEVLNECFIALKNGNVVNINLTETWWRSYQILAMRTHPHIMMDGTGGYLLTGIKVDSGSNDATETPIPAVNPPVNPSDPDPSKQNKTDVITVTPAGTSHTNPDTGQDGNLDDTSNLNDNPEIKSDSAKSDGESIEPPLKRTKSK